MEVRGIYVLAFEVDHSSFLCIRVVLTSLISLCSFPQLVKRNKFCRIVRGIDSLISYTIVIGSKIHVTNQLFISIYKYMLDIW